MTTETYSIYLQRLEDHLNTSYKSLNDMTEEELEYYYDTLG